MRIFIFILSFVVGPICSLRLIPKIPNPLIYKMDLGKLPSTDYHKERTFELYLNPYDPLSKVAAKFWNHVFPKNKFEKPINTHTAIHSKPIHSIISAIHATTTTTTPSTTTPSDATTDPPATTIMPESVSGADGVTANVTESGLMDTTTNSTMPDGSSNNTMGPPNPTLPIGQLPEGRPPNIGDPNGVHPQPFPPLGPHPGLFPPQGQRPPQDQFPGQPLPPHGPNFPGQQQPPQGPNFPGQPQLPPPQGPNFPGQQQSQPPQGSFPGPNPAQQSPMGQFPGQQLPPQGQRPQQGVNPGPPQPPQGFNPGQQQPPQGFNPGLPQPPQGQQQLPPGTFPLQQPPQEPAPVPQRPAVPGQTLRPRPSDTSFEFLLPKPLPQLNPNLNDAQEKGLNDAQGGILPGSIFSSANSTTYPSTPPQTLQLPEEEKVKLSNLHRIYAVIHGKGNVTESKSPFLTPFILNVKLNLTDKL